MSDGSTPTGLQGVVRLADWGVIRASGEDAARFLHGQLTQDMLQLGPEQARLAGYCSAKGRLLATFVVWRPHTTEFLLACSADLLPAVLKRLSMFVLRAHCRLTDASVEHPLWGLAGAPLLDLVGGNGATAAPWTRVTGTWGELLVLPPARVDGIFIPRAIASGALPSTLPALTVDAWNALEAHAGVARVTAATMERFVPQMVNLELAGGVSFQKGCFPGQEVVARSQYRGTLKRRAYVVLGDRPLLPAQEVFHDGDPGQPAGTVVNAGTMGDGRFSAFVELKIAATQGGALQLGELGGPALRLTDLPYAIPVDTA